MGRPSSFTIICAVIGGSLGLLVLVAIVLRMTILRGTEEEKKMRKSQERALERERVRAVRNGVAIMEWDYEYDTRPGR
jgi:hypothetical protein